jgi:hypothetical protein
VSVFVTSYEVNAAGLPIIKQHNDAVAAWKAAAWAIVKEVGGEGFRPSRGVGIHGILFREPPTGWRMVSRDPNDRNLSLYVPRKTSKAGKDLTARLASVGQMPEGQNAATLFGWNPSELAMDMSRGIVYFPTAQTIDLPSPRHFLRLPRFPKDGWPGHAGLTEVPESEYMRAIEAHNAVVRAKKAA